MNTVRLFFCAFAILFTTLLANAEDNVSDNVNDSTDDNVAASVESNAVNIVRWTDKNGKVHFSDIAPQDKSIKTEVFAASEAPRQGLTQEELKQQQKRVIEYKARLNKKSKQDKEVQQAASATTTVPQTRERTDADREADIIACRNKHTLTKALVECFTKANR